jgi:hypothetical protein
VCHYRESQKLDKPNVGSHSVTVARNGFTVYNQLLISVCRCTREDTVNLKSHSVNILTK